MPAEESSEKRGKHKKRTKGEEEGKNEAGRERQSEWLVLEQLYMSSLSTAQATAQARKKEEGKSN